MNIKTLVENTSISEEFKAEHGLCLYIETNKHKILFDLGASTLFVENAIKMGVILSEIDLVVISHGHYDHGGGLKAFMSVNSKAKICLNQKAFDKHYSNRISGEKVDIGMDQSLLPNDRFVFAHKYLLIDEELELFSDIQGNKLTSRGNQNLFMELGSSVIQDDFAHEQNLVINEAGKTVLVAGCAHKGIVNIIDHISAEKNSSISHVIGGFHLYNRSAHKYEELSLVEQIGEVLLLTGIKYYTCHCTGIEPYKRLKEMMDEKIQYLATGSQLII